MPVAIRPPLVLDFTMAAAASGAGPVTENVDYTALRPFVVMDFHNVCIAADAGSSTGLLRGSPGFVAICTAPVCAVTGVVTRMAAGFVSTQFVVAATNVVRVAFVANTNPATLHARAWARITPTAIAGA